MKDVELPDAPEKKILFLDKHANYIEAFEKDKNDLVRYDVVLAQTRSLYEPYSTRSTAARST